MNTEDEKRMNDKALMEIMQKQASSLSNQEMDAGIIAMINVLREHDTKRRADRDKINKIAEIEQELKQVSQSIVYLKEQKDIIQKNISSFKEETTSRIDSLESHMSIFEKDMLYLKSSADSLNLKIDSGNKNIQESIKKDVITLLAPVIDNSRLLDRMRTWLALGCIMMILMALAGYGLDEILAGVFGKI